ncbi:MAG: hypothetical protein II330_01945 [Clostridia bacterium]|nr:hypothetical protein [Clostridia bacterium]
MKRLKKHLFFTFICFCLLCTTMSGCSRNSSPYDFKYPKRLTNNDCFENYTVFDPNIRYTECYEFVDAGRKIRRLEYSAIKGAEDLSFMVCYKTIFWFGENRWMGVLREKDCDIQPIKDFTPSKIELCTYDDLFAWNPGSIDVEENPECYYRYAEHTFSDSILAINSEEAIAEIMVVAKRPTTMTTEENYREHELYPVSYELDSILWEEKPIYVKISFAECEGLVWVGQLLTDEEGNFYMERSSYVNTSLHLTNTLADPFYKSWGYPLGKHMEAILSELVVSE